MEQYLVRTRGGASVNASANANLLLMQTDANANANWHQLMLMQHFQTLVRFVLRRFIFTYNTGFGTLMSEWCSDNSISVLISGDFKRIDNAQLRIRLNNTWFVQEEVRQSMLVHLVSLLIDSSKNE